MAQDQRARQIPLHIAEAEPHPQAADIVKEIDVDKISNQQVHRFLNLKEGYNIMDNLEKKVLESYFGPYSLLAKSYRTYNRQDAFFHEVAKFLLEVACVSPRQYCMPKQQVGIIIETYDGVKVDWGYITRVASRGSNCAEYIKGNR